MVTKAEAINVPSVTIGIIGKNHSDGFLHMFPLDFDTGQ
jgi:hypothetical protein